MVSCLQPHTFAYEDSGSIFARLASRSVFMFARFLLQQESTVRSSALCQSRNAFSDFTNAFSPGLCQRPSVGNLAKSPNHKARVVREWVEGPEAKRARERRSWEPLEARPRTVPLVFLWLSVFSRSKNKRE